MSKPFFTSFALLFFMCMVSGKLLKPNIEEVP